MKESIVQKRINEEVVNFISSRKSLMLSTLTMEGTPYASYAPFAIGEECLYVLISEIALHAVNLQHFPEASVLIIEDEDSAGELFARIRVNYSVQAKHIEPDGKHWAEGIARLADRHGERINHLSQLADFKLFRLIPQGGRYVKGFGRAFSLAGKTLAGETVDHLRDGHQKRDVA
ncbi:MAG: pyridoxamine 5'-phosphate oxidase family protein [Porticoccus sp.]|jgi:putative heme iron utilization protein|uniref:HugZ family pyridoxamine 5'-phosphate oxidase n=1 Tax=Porticoccus sp. TaxID=2024853 RepID=UPI003297DB44